MGDYTDSFNRPNSANVSTNAPYTITNLNGGTAPEILSNAMHDLDTAALDSFFRMETDFASPDHEVSIRLATVTTSGATAVGAGPIISANTSAAVTCFFVIADFVAQTMTILDIVAGAVTNAYGTSAGLGAFAVGDVLTLGRMGSYVYAQKNGTTVISARSNLYYTGVRGGVYFSRSGVGVDVAINNWHAQDLYVVPKPPRAPGLAGIGEGLLTVIPLGTITDVANGTLQTDGTFAGTGMVTHLAAGTLTTAGTFTGTGKVTHFSAGTLTTNGTFAGVGKITHPASGTLTTNGTFSGVGKITHPAQGTLLTTGTFNGTGLVGHKTAGTLLTTGTFTGTGVDTPSNTKTATGALSTDGTFTGEGFNSAAVAAQTVGSGASLGRRGPYYPDRTPEQVLREEEELLVII